MIVRAWVTCPTCRGVRLDRHYGPWLVNPFCSSCRGLGQVRESFTVRYPPHGPTLQPGAEPCAEAGRSPSSQSEHST